jgi:LacI family transcriptional regulator
MMRVVRHTQRQQSSRAAGLRQAHNGRVTLKDIASAVGVDVSTVSKVLNAGDTITVRPDTRERILAEVARTGYVPNAAARSLKSSRTGALGMVLPDLANPLYSTIARGAVREAADLGYVMLMAELTADDPSMLQRLVSERRIDGLIVATARDEDREHLEDLDPLLPFVYVNRRVEGANRSISLDDEAAGALAAETMIAAGHTKLAFVGGSSTLDTARRRRRGFTCACAEAGIPAPADIERPYSRVGGADAAAAIAELDDRPTAVFASNLLVGVGLVAGLHRRGVTIPEEISIVTLDHEGAAYMTPPLTAIHLPFAELGATSVREVDRLLKGQPPRDVTVGARPHLVERGSLAPPPRG